MLNMSRKNTRKNSRKDSRNAERKDSRNAERKNTRKAERTFMEGGKVKVGSKAQVFHGTADRTAGGLTKSDLLLNKRGHIVSRKQMEAGKKAFKRLEALGYKPKKGVFKLFTKKTRRA
jgi:hypothetical protein